jgi:hypothetical protein
MRLDQLQAENERLKDGNQGGNNNAYLEKFVEMPPGKGVVPIRLLDQGGEAPFFVATRIHKVNGKSLHCARVLNKSKWEGDCVVCSHYSDLWKRSEKAASPSAKKKFQDAARAIKPIERYYYNCIVRSVVNKDTGQTEANVGPKILSVGKTLHKFIVTKIVGDADLGMKGLGDVTDPKTGRDLRICKEISKSGDETYPNYDKSFFADEVTGLGTPDQVKKWLAACHDLNALRNVKPREEMAMELKKHLGIIKDTASNYDPSEFQIADGESTAAAEDSETLTEEVRKPAPKTGGEVTRKPAAKAPAPAADVSDEDEPMADEDFMAELKAIK